MGGGGREGGVVVGRGTRALGRGSADARGRERHRARHGPGLRAGPRPGRRAGRQGRAGLEPCGARRNGSADSGGAGRTAAGRGAAPGGRGGLRAPAPPLRPGTGGGGRRALRARRAHRSRPRPGRGGSRHLRAGGHGVLPHLCPVGGHSVLPHLCPVGGHRAGILRPALHRSGCGLGRGSDQNPAAHAAAGQEGPPSRTALARR